MNHFYLQLRPRRLQMSLSRENTTNHICKIHTKRMIVRRRSFNTKALESEVFADSHNFIPEKMKQRLVSLCPG